jgi:hypothetical protein
MAVKIWKNGRSAHSSQAATNLSQPRVSRL